MPHLPEPLMRLFNDLIFRIYRNRRFMGFRVLRLTSIGARTGQERRTLLGYFDAPGDPDARIIVASSGGSARHPAWYFNLAKNPRKAWIEFGNEKLQVEPELLSDAERAAARQRIIAEAPSYAA
jgi:deazaflavin-dependent oxidoreductase (nitroreductase family)